MDRLQVRRRTGGRFLRPDSRRREYKRGVRHKLFQIVGSDLIVTQRALFIAVPPVLVVAPAKARTRGPVELRSSMS